MADTSIVEKRLAYSAQEGRFRRGIGVACCVHVSGNRAYKKEFDGSAALIKIDEQGRVTVFSAEADLGQGARTVLAQIAAEVLGIPLDSVQVATVDTESAPFGWGSFASRVTYLGGNAVKEAAAKAKEQILDSAAELWKVDRSELQMAEGMLVTRTGDKRMSLREAAASYAMAHAGSIIMATGFFVPDATYPDEDKYGNVSGAYPFAAQVAEVEVDTETGQVRVEKVYAAHDLGRAINPMLAEGQIEGGVAMGMGWAVSEQLIYEQGRILNDQFLDYQIPTMADMPPIEVYLVEPYDSSGPFGAKSLGEPALIPTAPAIANAILQATGVKVWSIPVQPYLLRQYLRNR